MKPSYSTLAADFGSMMVAVVASGSAPCTCQWSRNGVAVAGATDASYTATKAQLANAGRYRVAVTNAAGTIISGPAQVNLSGLLWAVGADSSGQLGIGTVVQRDAPVPIAGDQTTEVGGRISEVGGQPSAIRNNINVQIRSDNSSSAASSTGASVSATAGRSSEHTLA